MALGVIILAHANLRRTRQLAAALAGNGLHVAIHVDKKADREEANRLRNALKSNPNIRFAPRLVCEWGGFSLVKAGMGAAQMLLDQVPDLSHVIQISGDCLPTRPIRELRAHLEAHPGTDFVECVPADQPWVQGGLSEERFQYHFPFSWKRHRWAFDRLVDVQRALRVRRRVPQGLVPHLGSQWWCLSRETLERILNDTRRQEFDRFFKRCWIPDESYVPTLVQRHSKKLVSKSLILARFDDQGKPHLFYDDHAEWLASSDAFFARKIWPGANRLYRRFLQGRGKHPKTVEPLALEDAFAAARQRRCAGRPGLRNVGRFPAGAHERQPATAVPYTVFVGFGQVFDEYHRWLGNSTSTLAHGRLFQADRVVFTNRWSRVAPGGITPNAAIRDMNPEQFLTNMLWAGKGETQSFTFELADSARMAAFFARDPNATIIEVQGSWILDLFQRHHEDPGLLRNQARRLARSAREFESELRKAGGAANRHLIPLESLLCPSGAALKGIQMDLAPDASARRRALPKARSFDGLRPFLDRMHLMGIDTSSFTGAEPARSVFARVRARAL